MRCNNLGQADPNGGYDLIDGKPVLRDGTKSQMWQPGDYIGFNMAFLDSAAAPAGGHRLVFTDSSLTFTDAERTFLDSGEGREEIALAAAKHRLSESHKGPYAQPFEGGVRDAAIRHILIRRGHYQSTIQKLFAERPSLQAAHDTWVEMKNNRTA